MRGKYSRWIRFPYQLATKITPNLEVNRNSQPNTKNEHTCTISPFCIFLPLIYFLLYLLINCEENECQTEEDKRLEYHGDPFVG